MNAKTYIKQTLQAIFITTVIFALLVFLLHICSGCFDASNENNNYPSYGDGGWQSNGCTLEQWMAFYDENTAYINMSRETWLDRYPGGCK